MPWRKPQYKTAQRFCASRMTSPAGADPASVPLWGCFGLVGVALAISGGALIFAGMKRFDSVNPLTGPTAQALEEDMKWMNNPK